MGTQMEDGESGSLVFTTTMFVGKEKRAQKIAWTLVF